MKTAQEHEGTTPSTPFSAADSPAAILPQGYHCAVTWGIPTNFGGMTGAMLRRSRAFVTEGGVDVDILTFEYDPGYDELRCELEVAGELIPGMKLRNLWEELAGLSEDVLRTAPMAQGVSGTFSPLGAGDVFKQEGPNRSLGRRIRTDASGKTTLQVDYLRPDGTVFVSDQRDSGTPGETGRRLVTLCGPDGAPVSSWNQMWPLYLFWLDTVVGTRDTFMIVDSKSTANFITRFRRDNVITAHIVHNSHVAAGQVPPYGELSSVRKYTFERLKTYDAVVLLTQQQKADVDEVFQSGNTYVVPNSTELPAIAPPEDDRRVTEGVMLASLTGRKRIDHAIRAVALANQDAEEPFQLTIFGHGPERAALDGLVKQLDVAGQVTLPGFVADPRRQLENRSFVLLTSKAEGLPLVILEALSVGCIPIAYDMPYGPGETIIDGVNGYLVPAGDIEALAESLLRLGRLSPDEVRAMRAEGRTTAQRFGDPAVTAAWGRVLRDATDVKLMGLATKIKKQPASIS